MRKRLKKKMIQRRIAEAGIKGGEMGKRWRMATLQYIRLKHAISYMWRLLDENFIS